MMDSCSPIYQGHMSSYEHTKLTITEQTFITYKPFATNDKWNKRTEGKDSCINLIGASLVRFEFLTSAQ